MPTPKALNLFASEVLEVMPLMVREFAKREDNDLTRGKISCPQMVALHEVAEKGEVTVGDIAKVLSITKSSASALLDRLIRQKLMSRRHDNRDRRVVWVGITPQGRKVIAQIMSQKRRSIKAIFGPLTPTERHQYLSVLQKVRTHLVASGLLLFFAAAGLLQADDANAFLWFHKEKAKAPSEVAAVESPAQTIAELPLEEAFRKALRKSETVAISAEEMNQAQARFYRAFDTFLPTVSFEMTRLYQDTNPDNAGASGFGNSQRQNTPEKKFVFSQPLFSGFKEIAALQGTGADKKQQAFAWRRAKELLFVDVMEAYYSVLQAEKDVEVLTSTQDLLGKRRSELDSRVKIGRSRESETKAALVDSKLIEADLISAKNQVRVTRNLLEFYVGEPLEGLTLKEGPETDPVQDPTDAERTARERADVMSEEQAYIVAQKNVIAADADLYPKISLDGNYYTQRVGFQNGNDWDMTLKFDVPVFEVGQTLGDIKEAVTSREQARLKYQQAQRMAELDIRDARENLRSSRESEKALQEAERASKENYDILTAEYRTNLVSNLDALDALRQYQDTERNYQSAHFSARKNYWKLRVALGDVPGVES